ncbi:MAG: sugar-transfer associated ATP-grasp domain-containing protein [Pseudomonadota bacterium]
MAEPAFSLDAARDRQRVRDLDAPPRIDIAAHVRAAAKQGRGGFGLGREIWRLHRGAGKLTTAEYFYYRLYDPALSFEEKRRFIGKRAQARMHQACNDPAWFAVAHDKLLFDAVMRGAGLPVPRLRAVYHQGPRRAPVALLADAAALERHLSDSGSYPCFAKPIDGMFSVGGLDLAGIAEGRVRLGIGAAVALAALVRYMTELGTAGYLLQDRLRPHPTLARAFGPTLGALRFLVLVEPSGPRVLSAVCKIPSVGNMADNFWRKGNMLGAIDLGSGTIRQAVSGVGEGRMLHERHPDTGEPIVGLALPDWREAVDLCRTAAGVMPAIRTQSWDIALTDAGPVLLELNFGGDLNLHQLAHGKGLLEGGYVEHLGRCGYRVK